MKMLIGIVSVIIIGIGLGNSILEPKDLVGKSDLYQLQSKVVSSMKVEEDFRVDYFVKGSSIFVECYLKDFTFTTSTEKELATVFVFIDGKKTNEMDTAAFIIKNIPMGSHKIRLEVHQGGQALGFTKQFKVNINTTL